MKYRREIGFEIRALSNLIRRDFEKSKINKELEDVCGINGWVIGYLYDHRDGDIFQRDFETEFSIRRSTATNILQSMEKKGLIIRQSVDYDARLKKITLTDKAVVIHNHIMADIKERENRLTAGLTKKEIDLFFEITKKLKANLEAKND